MSLHAYNRKSRTVSCASYRRRYGHKNAVYFMATLQLDGRASNWHSGEETVESTGKALNLQVTHELWAVTEKTSSWTQTVEMSFLDTPLAAAPSHGGVNSDTCSRGSVDAFLGRCSSQVPTGWDPKEDPGHTSGTRKSWAEVAGAREAWTALL